MRALKTLSTGTLYFLHPERTTGAKPVSIAVYFDSPQPESLTSKGDARVEIFPFRDVKIKSRLMRIGSEALRSPIAAGSLLVIFVTLNLRSQLCNCFILRLDFFDKLFSGQDSLYSVGKVSDRTSVSIIKHPYMPERDSSCIWWYFSSDRLSEWRSSASKLLARFCRLCLGVSLRSSEHCCL